MRAPIWLMLLSFAVLPLTAASSGQWRLWQAEQGLARQW
jgi:hypothetical protein